MINFFVLNCSVLCNVKIVCFDYVTKNNEG